MIEHIWSILCSRSVTDRDTNNIILLDVLEQITAVVPIRSATEDAGLLSPNELVSLWSRSVSDRPERGRGRIRLLAPDGSELGRHEFDIDLTQRERLRTQTRSAGLPIRGSGRYDFIVDLQEQADADWREVCKVPLKVVIQSLEPAPEPTGGVVH